MKKRECTCAHCAEKIAQLQAQIDELWSVLLMDKLRGIERQLDTDVTRTIAKLDSKTGSQVDPAALDRIEAAIDRIGEVGSRRTVRVRQASESPTDTTDTTERG